MSEEYSKVDYSKVEIIRGKTPADIQQRCHQLCKEYLGDIWSEIAVDDIHVQRITGGMSNQLYRCSVGQSAGPGAGGAPVVVAIRLFGDCVDNHRYNDLIIISLLMSEHCLGPKLLGSFRDGDIQQFIDHRHFRVAEQNDSTLVSKVAKQLARMHSMRPPINSRRDWQLSTMDDNMQNAYKRFAIKDLIDEYQCTHLRAHDLTQELRWLRGCVERCDSPVCFAHNDFRGNNIMVYSDVDINGNDCHESSEEHIVFCDFEKSAYGYRGSDLGSLFAEWNRHLPNDYQCVQRFPDDAIMRPFVDEYIRESVARNGGQYACDERNTVAHIVREIKVFTLVSNFFMVSACLALEDSKDMPILTKELLMRSADKHFENYLQLKARFSEDDSVFQ